MSVSYHKKFYDLSFSLLKKIVEIKKFSRQANQKLYIKFEE